MRDRWVVVLAVLVLVAGGAWAWQGLKEPVHEAPPFTLASTGFENGTMGAPVTFSLSDYAGQTVVLDLMAVNCDACEVVVAQVLKPLTAEHPDVVILSIDTWADPATGQSQQGVETVENVIALQKDRGLHWRHALDTDDVWLKYQAITLPKLVVVGPEQQVVAQFHGVPSYARVEDAVLRAQSGGAAPDAWVRLPVLGLAAVAGFVAFFAPCSVGLVPAYLGMLMHGRSTTRAVLGAGLSAGAGVLLLYTLAALLLLAFGPVLAAHLATVRIVTGVLLVIVGSAMLVPGLWNPLVQRGLGRIDARRGHFSFGVAFGLASFGCTGPAFLPILLGAFARGPGLGFAAMAVYGGAFVLLLTVAATMVAFGREGPLRRLLGHGVAVQRVAAALLVAAGVYVLWFQSLS